MSIQGILPVKKFIVIERNSMLIDKRGTIDSRGTVKFINRKKKPDKAHG